VHVILASAVLMATTDLMTVVNVALPTVSADLHNASLPALSWVLDSYAIVHASLLVPAGRMADRGSRRTAFLIGLAVFTGGSALCALAPDLPVLVAARVVQAIGAAGLIPGSLSVLLSSYPPTERPKAVRAWTAVGGVGAAIGPLVGGPARAVAGPVRSLLLVAGVGLLSLALISVNDWGWARDRELIVLAFTVALIGWFIDRSSHHRRPVISMTLMRPPGVAKANLGGMFFAMSFATVVL
jgi:MFS family permease